ncbi:MAG: tetratricopeptide repeat protein, partial [Patescibacteria group bacterium]
QFAYANEALTAAAAQISTENTKLAALAYYDLRKLFPKETSKTIPSYFYEAKAYSFINDLPTYSSKFAQFQEMDNKGQIPALQAEGIYLLGKIQSNAQQYNDAINTLGQVETKFPKETKLIIDARKELAVCYQKSGNTQESIRTLEETLSKYTGDDYNQAYINLMIGLSYQQLGDRTNAAAALQKVADMPSTPGLRGPQMAARAALQQYK